MQTARRLIVGFSCAIVLWVFASVAGALLDPAHAAFWSSSLMWSFLSTLLVAPALVMIFDPSLTHDSAATHPRRTAVAQARSASEGRSTSDRPALADAQQSFVEDAAGAAHPVPDEPGEQRAAPAASRPDWTGTYAV